jgi:hypothetical protein
MLNTNDLNEYFRANTMEIEDLLKLADQLTSRYLTTQASEQVLHGRSTNFVIGSPWTAPPTASWFTPGSDSEELNKDDASESGSLFEEDPGEPDIIGDQVLANTILRMRDSMAHYEFQCSIAEGDIGRALNIMAVSFTVFDTRLSVHLASDLDIHLHGIRKKQVLQCTVGACMQL